MAGRRMPASLGFAPKLRLQTHFLASWTRAFLRRRRWPRLSWCVHKQSPECGASIDEAVIDAGGNRRASLHRPPSGRRTHDPHEEAGAEIVPLAPFSRPNVHLPSSSHSFTLVATGGPSPGTLEHIQRWLWARVDREGSRADQNARIVESDDLPQRAYCVTLEHPLLQ